MHATSAAGAIATDALELGAISQAQAPGATPTSGPRSLLQKVWQFMNRPWVRALRETASAATTFVPLAIGKTELITGGRYAWAAQAGMGIGAVGGTIDLVQDWRRDPRHSRMTHSLVMAGGYLVASGSVIGLFGGVLPGAVIAATGSLVRALGFVGYMIEERRNHP